MRKAKYWVIAASAAVLTCMLAACATGTNSDGSGATSPAATSNASTIPSVADSGAPSNIPVSVTSTPVANTSPAAVVTVAPSPGKQISPTTPITVSVAQGTVQAVKLVNDSGVSVTGSLSADGLTWTNSEPLGYGRSYTLSATATNTAGRKTVKQATYTTLTPTSMTMPYFQFTGGYTLHNGATYGVGIVPIVHWDEPITDRNAALNTISVTTTPHVAGAWYWADSQNVAFRPAATAKTAYWPAHTKVTITVKDYGKAVSPGLYGQADTKVTFKIGDKRVTVARDNAPKSVNTVITYVNDKKVKVFHTSMGRHSSVTYGGRKISFWTMQGTYTVLEHDNPATMSSESYGLPADAPGGYAPEKIYWATKISTDGIYLHELTTTIWAQENGQDVSHGCLNLSTENATWFFKHSIPGDVVVVRSPGAPEISYAQGGAWSVPWKVWVAGGRKVA